MTSFLPQLTGSLRTPAAGNPTVQLMEAAYRDAGLDFRYINCDVKPEGLLDAIRGRPGMTVADVMTNPPMTGWLTAAEGNGCTILTGLGMLVNQAAVNGRLWTGVDLNKQVMRRELSAIFGLAP